MKFIDIGSIVFLACHIGTVMAVEILKVGDIGPQSIQAAKRNPDKLVLVYIPPLSALLARASELKGKPLSETEIQRIAGQAEVVAMHVEVAESVIQQRGGST